MRARPAASAASAATAAAISSAESGRTSRPSSPSSPSRSRSAPQRAAQVMAALDAMGVRLSIDDFGTGYTSLAQLRRLPVDEVKIDRSFVMNMLRDANDAMIVRSILDLAHNMNRTVVAEGVETLEQQAFLYTHGCHEMQGFLFSPAVPAQQIASLLESGFPVQHTAANGG